MSGLRRSDRFRGKPAGASVPAASTAELDSEEEERRPDRLRQHERAEEEAAVRKPEAKRRRLHQAVFVEDRLEDLLAVEEDQQHFQEKVPVVAAEVFEQQDFQQRHQQSSRRKRLSQQPKRRDQKSEQQQEGPDAEPSGADIGMDVDVEDCATGGGKQPRDWREVWRALEHMRAPGGAAADAPVDTLGCHMLGDAEVETPTTFRFTTLVSLMLSSQTKDQVTAQAVRSLQQHFAGRGGLTIANLATEEEATIRRLIYGVGFHNRKAGYLLRTAQLLLPRGDIPDSVEGLCELPGVGPKMAHLAMLVAWDTVSGIGVDTHVHRISQRLGWAKTQTPEQTRLALQAWLPRELWPTINHLLVGFGQRLCTPLRPQCERCEAIRWCPVGRRHPAYRALRKQEDASSAVASSSASSAAVSTSDSEGSPKTMAELDP